MKEGNGRERTKNSGRQQIGDMCRVRLIDSLAG